MAELKGLTLIAYMSSSSIGLTSQNAKICDLPNCVNPSHCD